MNDPAPYDGSDQMPIRGQWRPCTAGRELTDTDPCSGDVLTRIPLVSAADVAEAVTNSRSTSTGTLARVLIFLVALLIVRGLSALLYRPLLSAGRQPVIAGLLEATNLSIPIVGGSIGVDLGLIRPQNYVALWPLDCCQLSPPGHRFSSDRAQAAPRGRGSQLTEVVDVRRS